MPKFHLLELARQAEVGPEFYSLGSRLDFQRLNSVRTNSLGNAVGQPLVDGSPNRHWETCYSGIREEEEITNVA